MNAPQARIRASGLDGRSEDRRSREAGAACTAWVWLALYSVAITGSLLFGPWKHQHDKPVVAVVQISVEQPE